MTNPTPTNPTDSSDELTRVTEQIATRLRARGVDVQSADSSDHLGSLLEAVEAFESAVEAKGGDLMVDEAPEGKTAEPDNQDFVLPRRNNGESAGAYISRINSAASSLQG